MAEQVMVLFRRVRLHRVVPMCISTESRFTVLVIVGQYIVTQRQAVTQDHWPQVRPQFSPMAHRLVGSATLLIAALQWPPEVLTYFLIN